MGRLRVAAQRILNSLFGPPAPQRLAFVLCLVLGAALVALAFWIALTLP
jgi:hypothetical protein